MMPLFALAFLVGDCLFQQLAQLPQYLAIAVVFELLCISYLRRAWILVGLFSGWLWAAGFAHYYDAKTDFAATLEGKEIRVQGRVSSLPQMDERKVHFDFSVTKAEGGIPAQLKLNWYHPPQTLRAGQEWSFVVKLKAPHGLLNPGGFDYERWLFTQGVGATGYVRQAQLMVQPPDWQSISGWRQAIAERIATVPGLRWSALFSALTIGKTDGITPEQWQVLRATGTVHLIAISGSHISLLAGWVYFVVLRFWACLPILRFSPQTIAAWTALLSAFIYALLAGFATPVQRAMLMFAVAMLAVIGRRHITSTQLLALAVVAVLLWDPFAVLAPGFWLSFVAIALIFYTLSARLAKPKLGVGLLKVNLVTAFGMLPLMIGWFQQLSLIAPIANFIAVPVISLLIVPLALIAVLMLFCWPALGYALLRGLDAVFALLWQCLQHLATLQYATLNGVYFPLPLLLLAGVGSLILWLPRGFPARYTGLMMLIPLLSYQAAPPPPGEIRFTLLDVGQGLASVVQTAGHVLVYDTGIKFSEHADSGQSVLLPYLSQQRVQRVDGLVISHGDNDHIGGAAALIDAYPPAWVLTSVPEALEPHQALRCTQGQQWQWDGVLFSVLAPKAGGFARENNNSCVLKISTTSHSVLLTGDIEQEAEQWLVENSPAALQASVLIAPHHGSRTSSSVAFLRAVNPELILIPAGYHNQFNFPDASVILRYRDENRPWLNVADQGAITLATHTTALEVSMARKKIANYWNN